MSYDNFGGPAEPPDRVPLPSPLRWVIVLAGCLLLVVAAFVGGWVLARNMPKEAPTFGGTPMAPAPADWSEFAYPGGEWKDVAPAGGAGFGTARVNPGTTAAIVTSDSFDKVLTHYAQKLGLTGVITASGTGNTSGSRYLPAGAEVYDCSYTTASRAGMKIKLITYRTSVYDLVIHVSRADGEKQTHVIVSYTPHP